MKAFPPALGFTLLLAASALAVRASVSANQLTPDEVSGGWRLLWDGQTPRGWRSVRGPDFPGKGWLIKDGVLAVVPEGGGGDIITVGTYSNFELTADFKITPGCNSGIKIFVDPEINKAAGMSIGLEYQILDDLRNSDARQGKDGNRTLGSLYDLYPPSPDKRPNPVGEWNTARIVSNGARVEHWLNSRIILDYTRFTPEFRQRVAESKFKVCPGFGELRRGHILLQDHGDEAFFRNLKIRVLPGEAGPADTP